MPDYLDELKPLRPYIDKLEAEVERLRQTLFTAEDEILRMGKLYQRDCQGRLYVRLQVENAELKAKVKRLKPYEQLADELNGALLGCDAPRGATGLDAARSAALASYAKMKGTK